MHIYVWINELRGKMLSFVNSAGVLKGLTPFINSVETQMADGSGMYDKWVKWVMCNTIRNGVDCNKLTATFKYRYTLRNRDYLAPAAYTL